MTWQKITIIATAIVSIGGAITYGKDAWQWGVKAVIGEQIASIDRSVKTIQDQHDTDIEQLAGDLSWLRFIRWHEILKNGGRIDPESCKAYRTLAKRFNMRPFPC